METTTVQPIHSQFAICAAALRGIGTAWARRDEAQTQSGKSGKAIKRKRAAARAATAPDFGDDYLEWGWLG